MGVNKLNCEQAIFTSIRARHAEGYRIIAASRGLRDDEKRKITRCSPSHDALCPRPEDVEDPPAGPDTIAFYPLSNGRLCVSLSVNAGAEHTGRGGQRIYTRVVAFDADRFAEAGYNPHAIHRGMVTAGLHVPELQPPSPLPPLELEIEPETSPLFHSQERLLPESLPEAWFVRILEDLLNEGCLIVNLDKGWMEVSEALMLAVPGPMRSTLSFSTGTRYSVARSFRLALLFDKNQSAKKRTAGRRIVYHDTLTGRPPPTPTNAWLSFVLRHRHDHRVADLARRTQRPYDDVTPDGRERIGTLYNDLDGLEQMDLAPLLDKAGHYLSSMEGEQTNSIEHELMQSVIDRTQHLLCERIEKLHWRDLREHWPRLCAMGRRHERTRRWADPLIQSAMTCAMRDDAFAAAESALLMVEQDSPMDPAHRDTLLDGVLDRLATWVGQASPESLARLPQLLARWQSQRPASPQLSALKRHCPTPTPSTAG